MNGDSLHDGATEATQQRLLVNGTLVGVALEISEHHTIGDLEIGDLEIWRLEIWYVAYGVRSH